MSKKLVIYGKPKDLGACGNYRVILPLEHLKENHDIFLLERGTGVDKALPALEKANVVVIQRPRSKTERKFFQSFRDSDKLVVFEHDDNTWQLNPISDHYRYNGVEEVRVAEKDMDAAGLGHLKKNCEDGWFWLWKDGRADFDIERNLKAMDNFNASLANADVITTTTDRLAKLFEERNHQMGGTAKAYALPNCLDMRDYMPVEIKHDDIRILWQGGASHYHDLLEIKDVLTELCKKYPQVTIILAGTPFPGVVKDIDPKQVQTYDKWTEWVAHSYRMALFGADINICPIEKNEFNQYKSSLKAYESMALGIPTVATDYPPYSDDLQHDKTALLAKDNKDWFNHLEALVKSAELRKRLGAAGRKWVMENRNIEKQAHLWESVYVKELERKRKQLGQPKPDKRNPKTDRRRDRTTTTSKRSSQGT